MSEREELEQAMTALEKQHTVLRDVAVEAALAGLQQKLAALDKDKAVSREQQLTRLMPQALAEKMRATAHAEGERKQVSVLFADLSPGSIVDNWVKENGNRLHHMALLVDSAEKTKKEWEQLGFAEFTTEEPTKCPGLIQIFAKPSSITGIIWEGLLVDSYIYKII